MTFLELAETVLEKAEYPLGYKEIWEQAKIMGLTNQIVKGEWEFKTPPQTIMQNQLHDNIRQKKDNSKFYKASIRPTTFWLKSRESELGSETEIEQKRQEIYKVELDDYENKLDKKGFKEKELHSVLVGFVAEEFGLYCKTIDVGTSKKGEAGLGEWNHPDIVGIHFPFDDYEDIAFDLLHKINKVNYKIYSFEIKRVINPKNLKECYFQAVSNSSWANYGYLVAWEIKLDERAKMEAERLNESFGIGMIELKNDNNKAIIFEAKERELDIRTFNMLVGINTNFREFIRNICGDIKTFLETKERDRINTIKYDKILSGDKLESYKQEIRRKAE